jgi:hypothetical protein
MQVTLLLWAWRDGGDIVPTRQNQEGATPLGLAAYHGHLDVVQALVEAGVSGVSPDKFKFRPVQLAAQNGHVHVVRWLEERGYTWPPPESEHIPHSDTDATNRLDAVADASAAAREDRVDRLAASQLSEPEPAQDAK